MTAPNPPVIGDLLADGLRLEIWCTEPDCRRHVLWPAAEAVAKLGARTPFVVAREHLVCSTCKAAGCGRPGWLVIARASIEDYYANLRARGLMG